MRRCINPMCFQGDPGDPPEYESDCAVECGGCGNEIDLDDDPYVADNDGNYFCEERAVELEKD